MYFVLFEDIIEYFVRIKVGGVCFKLGIKMLEKFFLGRLEEKAEGGDGGFSVRGSVRYLLSVRERAGGRGGARRKWVECVCLSGWYGSSCGVFIVV